MDASTSPELLSVLPAIADKPEDTPRPVGSERRRLPMSVLALTLRGCPETNVQQINLLEISKSLARDRLSSKSVLSLALHMT